MRNVTVTITVTRRADDFHACIADAPEYWAAGKDSVTAIGDLIATHPAQFGINHIEYLQTGEEWARQTGVEIIDPDGWRTEGISFFHPICQEAWERLRDMSTIKFSVS